MAIHSQLLLQQFQMAAAINETQTGCGDGSQAAMMFQQMAEPLAVFSEPRSELTCNLSGSRKRAREEPSSGLPTISSTAILYQQQRQFLLQKQQALLVNQIHHKSMHTTADVPIQTTRIVQSVMTSTSGRPPLAVSASAELSNVSAVHNNISDNNVSGVVSSSNNLISMLNYQSTEMESLIRLHEQKLRSGLQKMRKRQCTALVSAIQQEAQRRIAEKQAEMEVAAKRSAELEDRLREVTAESQAWFNVAKNSETLVTGLRASLEQALLQKVLSGGNNNGNCAAGMDLPSAVVVEEEGYGDSEEAGATTAGSCPAWCPEASSSMVGVAARNDASAMGGCCLRCKSCGESDACVLLLPCRHLCLCPSCESTVSECPVCGVGKNTALQISLSY